MSKLNNFEKREKALKKVDEAYYDRTSPHYKNNERFSWAVETISASKLIEDQNHEEELWCAHQYLNDRNVPTDKNGERLSIVGRIMAYQRMTHDDAYLVQDDVCAECLDHPTLDCGFHDRTEYVGECKGNDGNGCFMDSCGHNCGCFKKVIKNESTDKNPWNDANIYLPENEVSVLCYHQDSSNYFICYRTLDCLTKEPKWFGGAMPTHWKYLDKP